MTKMIGGKKVRPRIGLGPRQLQDVLAQYNACTAGRRAARGLTLAQAWRRLDATYLLWWLSKAYHIGQDAVRAELGETGCICSGCCPGVARRIRLLYSFDGTRKPVKDAAHV